MPKDIDAKLEHASKADSPIVVNSSLIMSDVISKLFWNADPLISKAVSRLGFSSVVKSRVAGKVPVYPVIVLPVQVNV